jgi:long-subunit acyl-CoA synthetase (AMP-forming)
LHIRDVLYLEEGAFQHFLTPKMSIKRRDVVTHYQQEIDIMYKNYV